MRWTAAVVPAVLFLAGCGSVPLTETGTLTSYDKLGAVSSGVARARSFVDTPAVVSARSVSIIRTTLSTEALSKVKSRSDRTLVANAMDRAICIALSDRFLVVPAGHQADLTVRAVIADLVPTGTTAAGLSKVVTLGTSVILPVGVPRIPSGLGGLAVEAEAVDGRGVQRAAIVWSRRANSFTNAARISEIGDAYTLATAFGHHFSRMLVTGKAKPPVSLPSGQLVRSSFGGKPANEACEAFGRAPGVGGFFGGIVGAPPSWSDTSPDPSNRFNSSASQAR